VAVHRISKGLDVPLAGAPTQVVDAAVPVGRVGLIAADALGLKPTLLVRAGDRVRRGEPLFEDKAAPGVRYTAPAAGTIRAVHRGDMRALQSVVIDVGDDDGDDAQVAFAGYTGRDPATLDADAVRRLLVESGLWTSFRTRPFSRVPAPATSPRAIFVTAMDTHPHAPDPEVVLRDRAADFAAGMACVARLAPGRTCLCRGVGSGIAGADGITVEEFSGPHPAGTPGVHIHIVDPVDHGRVAWHVGYQDVAAIGHLFRTGRLDVSRVVALAGPGVVRPRLLRTRLGASTDELTRGEIKAGEPRIISGSVLDGRVASGEVLGFLGRYRQQISVLPEGRERELFGWIAPGAAKFSLWGVVLGHWRPRAALPLTTTTNGGARAMVPIGGYERVLPMDLPATFLLRALITGDVEQAEELGVLELDEEDVALCTFVCPGKYEYGPLLRTMLDRIAKEA
jgi:Na+-transporting NADH:ubiquinone oxidoreductase subunit A